MTKTISAVGRGRLSAHGKRWIAESMYAKGKAFLGAAILLRHKKGNDYVVLHLVCHGIEDLLKGLLLFVDYDKFKPKLRDLGHDLVEIADAVSEAGLRPPLRQPIRTELEGLSRLYSSHRLRYGSGYDILVDPKTIPSKRVLRYMGAVLRFVERRRLIYRNAI